MMGSMEFRGSSSLSSEPAPALPATTPETEEERRKKLERHFLESDQRSFDGRSIGGTTPVDVHGRPIADLSKTGGWIAAFFIFGFLNSIQLIFWWTHFENGRLNFGYGSVWTFSGNEMTERMAYFGLAVNVVIFLFKVMHQPFTVSANIVNNFLGISQASSIIGGFIADAYLGRYWTIAIFTTLYLTVNFPFILSSTASVYGWSCLPL